NRSPSPSPLPSTRGASPRLAVLSPASRQAARATSAASPNRPPSACWPWLAWRGSPSDAGSHSPASAFAPVIVQLSNQNAASLSGRRRFFVRDGGGCGGGPGGSSASTRGQSDAVAIRRATYDACMNEPSQAHTRQRPPQAPDHPPSDN